MSKHRAWCLSWEDDEAHGVDVAGYDPLTVGWRSDSSGAIWIPFRGDTLDPEEVAEAYAEYCHSNRDGWESSWPLTFRVRLPDGSTQDFEVERETVPQFSAARLREKAATP